MIPRPEPTPTRINVNGSMEITDVNCQVINYSTPSYYGNDLKELNLNQFKWLGSIEIGDECFGSVKIFQIDGLNRLKSIKIGNNSFTQLFSDDAWDWRKANKQSRSFHILNCESLESIQIGEFSFSDFAGGFELKNLPHLQSIQIGEIGGGSCNFCYSSFVIRGIEMILNI